MMDDLKDQFSMFIFLCFLIMFANVASDRSKYIIRIVVATHSYMIAKNPIKFEICL